MHWKPILLVVFLALGTGTTHSHLADSPPDGRLVFTGATLIDGTGSAPLAGHVLIVREGRILPLVPESAFAAQSGDQVVDARGKYIIPGLWDMHFHLTIEEELAPRLFALLLAHGVTGVRDVGGLAEKVLHWRDQARANPRAAPRVAAAGPLIDGFPTVYDGSAPHRPNLSVTVRDAEEMVKTVDELAAAGVDFLKAYEMLSADSFRALLERASIHGLRVAGHVPFSVTANEAAELGIGSIEHFRNVELAISTEAQTLLKERREQLRAGKHLPGGDLRSSIHRAQRLRALDTQCETARRELIALMARRGTAQAPTLVIMAGSRIRMDADPGWAELLALMPDSLRESWQATAQRLAAMSEEEWEGHHRFADWLLGITLEAYLAGVPILAGTDTPVPLALPGHSLHEELRGLVLAGLPEMAALQAATLEAVRWLGLEEETGTIEPGKAADLVVLDANPLQDIRHTRRVWGVVRAGRYFDRAALDFMLESGQVPPESGLP